MSGRATFGKAYTGGWSAGGGRSTEDYSRWVKGIQPIESQGDPETNTALDCAESSKCHSSALPWLGWASRVTTKSRGVVNSLWDPGLLQLQSVVLTDVPDWFDEGRVILLIRALSPSHAEGNSDLGAGRGMASASRMESGSKRGAPQLPRDWFGTRNSSDNLACDQRSACLGSMLVFI
ncbi:hypothetical protein R1flu_012860 [Riccia fluitans]|uniref:Uncharacterized protein n=1 Tax=Riccia fluitans TaxID=41844 RepID=A0ABD1ZD12_9MARC